MYACRMSDLAKNLLLETFRENPSNFDKRVEELCTLVLNHECNNPNDKDHPTPVQESEANSNSEQGEG